MTKVAWTRSTPSFEACVEAAHGDFADDMPNIHSYVIATSEIFNMSTDTFMKCAVTDMLSDGDLFAEGFDFWQEDMHFTVFTEANSREWSDLTGVDMPSSDTDMPAIHDYLDRELSDAWNLYITAWIQWLAHYVEKAEDRDVAIEKLFRAFKSHGNKQLFIQDERGEFHIRPGFNIEVSLTDMKARLLRVLNSTTHFHNK